MRAGVLSNPRHKYPLPASSLRNLRVLDISVAEGTELIFTLLLSPEHPPTLTTVPIGGYSYDGPTEPIEMYFQCFGAHITSFSLSIWVIGGLCASCIFRPASRHSELFTTATRNFEWRVLASTPALESLQLAPQYPREFPTTLTTILASSNVTSLVLEIRPCPVDWRFLDKLFSSAQFKRLQCVSFVDWMGKEDVWRQTRR
jgi:hypothetical protein